MQIKLRNYHYNGNVQNYQIPQFKIRKLTQSQNKVKTSPQKYQKEKPMQSILNKANNHEKIKMISMSLDVRNQSYICKQPILYNCNINEDTYIWNQKPVKITKRIIPSQLKAEEKSQFLDDAFRGQSFRRFSEKYNDSHRSKDSTQLKLQLKSKTISKDLEIDPKGWTNRSSHSLL